MILFLTSRCNMNCTHCLSSCKEIGCDMAPLVFSKSIKFLHKIEPASILISGGEPTLYPSIIHIIRRLRFEFPDSAIALLTNGTFTESEYIMEQLPKLDCIVQITHDPNYYNKPIDEKKLAGYDIVNKVENLSAYGRAAKNYQTFNGRTTPFCFNMRSLLKHTDFISANKNREASFKFSSWGITPRGDITLSESLLCPTVGNIIDPLDAIEDNIRHFKCANCIYARKLMMSDPVYATVLK